MDIKSCGHLRFGNDGGKVYVLKKLNGSAKRSGENLETKDLTSRWSEQLTGATIYF